MRKISSFLRHILVSALTAALVVGPAAPRAFAGPTQIQGGNTALGAVRQDPLNPNQWTVTAPNGAIIHFSNFDIHPGESVTFIQPGSTSRALNRIFSAAPTHIDGDLSANGHIYIVNPAGVVFGKGATVNVTGLQAVGGHLSDRDFARGVDHFTGVRGTVDNQANITASAVSLVGGRVSNSGQIQASGGWIVMAAGRDVLIGRDGDGNGVLLRVEGAANAVFNPNATGVSNTGTLRATADTTDPAHPKGGTVSLGAGDLYGTAIFSNGAIEARKIALSADNRGNVALGGSVKADELDVTQRGSQTGELRGTEPGTPQTINANTVNLLATDAKGKVRVGDGLAFRGLAHPEHGPDTVNVSQKAQLHTSDLEGLELGDTGRENVALNLEATNGALVVDDRKPVTGTKLDLTGLNEIDIHGADPLVVDSLGLNASSTLSEASLVATGAGGITAVSNIQFLTNPKQVNDPALGSLISAHNGTLSVDGDITTTDGGTLRIEAQDVAIGTFDPLTGATHGGIVDISGSVPSHLEIGFTNAAGEQQTHSVELNAINTQGRKKDEKSPAVAGGDVDVNATGDVTVNGTIVTRGEASKTSGGANLPGGSVRIATSGATSTVTVGGVITGGADAPVAGAPEQGAISLTGPKVVVSGNLDARGGTNHNADGSRDRSVTVNGDLELGADTLQFFGGDVAVTGKTTRGRKNPGDPNDPTLRTPALTIASSGGTTLGGPMDLEALTINSRGKDVVFGGDVTAGTSVDVTFNTPGIGVWRTTGSGPVTVQANRVSATALDSTATNGKAASVSIDPNLHFVLADKADDPTTTLVDESAKGRFLLDQDAAIGSAATSLFAPGRFSVLAADPGATPVAGLGGATILLRSHDVVSLDADARANLAKTDLSILAADFQAPADPGTVAGLDLSSLDLTTLGALDANFDVTAAKSISLHSGGAGTGDLTLGSHLNSDSVTLVAGDGSNGNGTATVVFSDAARIRASDGTSNAKKVVISQDADLATASLPDAIAFGDGPNPLAGLDYELESRDGAVTVSAGQDAKIAGSSLTLTGQNGVDLGDSLPVLASLAVATPQALDVATAITTSPGGKIELHSGTDGSGDLSIESTLASDTIDLIAGSGNGVDATAKVVLNPGAFFESASSTPGALARPSHFELQQDAIIGGASGTQIPDAALFGGPLAGMELLLGSAGSSVTVKDPSQVAGTNLQLIGHSGVIVNGDLDVASLDVTGATTLQGDVTSAGDLKLHSAVTLGGDPNTVVTQTLDAGGDLTADKAITRSTNGNIVLRSAGALSVGDVATSHGGGSLEVHGGASVKTGSLNTSANTLVAGGAVTVTSSGLVDLGGVDTHGSAGRAQSSTVTATDGTNGGDVTITGSEILAGTITSVAGPGGAPEANQPGTTRGGDAGTITLTAGGGTGVIGLRGNVLADGGAGGAGTSTDPAVPAVNGPSGSDANVSLHGSVQLLESRATTSGTDDGPTNVIHGNVVAIDGGVGPGADSGDPAVGFTGLTIVADNGLSVGGDMTAGKLDLEVHHGGLALNTARVTQLNADSIRVAASDGHGGDLTGAVDLANLSFAGSDRTSPVGKFTLGQDVAIGGPGGTPIDVGKFGGPAGTRAVPFSLGLISQDGDVTVGATDLANLNGTLGTRNDANGVPRDAVLGGTNLLLASNGAIAITGDVILPSLTLGTTTGVGGNVGGNTSITGNLRLGSEDVLDAAVLTAAGNVDVTGDAHLFGDSKFVGNQDQTLSTGGQLEFKGSQNVKTGTGNFVVDSADINLSGEELQTIANDGGALRVTSGLVKDTGDLSLRGITDDDTTAAVIVDGTQQFTDVDGTVRDVALRTNDGSISVAATTRANSATGSAGVGKYDLHGDVIGYGNVTLNGRGELSGKPGGYLFEARRGGTDAAGELTVGGIASSDGKVTLAAQGPDATPDDQHPAAIHLKGDFTVAHGLDVQDAADVVDDTTITGTGDDDVSFDSRIQGAKNLSIKSHGAVLLGDDVAMTAGTFAAGGDRGVRFVSTNDSQSITAGTISLGNGAANAPKGRGSLLRDGDLRISALSGNVAVAPGQRLIANGSLNVSASGSVALGDTAALGISVTSSDLAVYGGSTIAANSIVVSTPPHVTGGNATFAVPTRTEVSSNVPSDDVLVRALTPTGEPLSFAAPPDGQPFDPAFPTVAGAGLFDFAREIPQWQPREPLARPHADPLDLQAALRVRPLWAEELLGYLEMRSLEAPNAAGRPTEAEHLPPVGARPGEELAPADARVRSAAVENAVAAYRELFRADLRRDPESGVIDQPSQAAAIRAAFQAPVDKLRRERPGKEIAAEDVSKLVETESQYAAARRYREQLSALLDVAERALVPDQRPRFRTLVLTEVTPYGITPAEFQSLF